jgi:hypothetical protein
VKPFECLVPLTMMSDGDFSLLISVFHHLGDTSTWHLAQERSGGGVGSTGVSAVPSFDPRIGLTGPPIDDRLLGVLSVAIASFIKSSSCRALRVVPVRATSACLKFWAYTCSAVVPVSSTFSERECTVFLTVGACSLHQITALTAPVSPPKVTTLMLSRLELFTGFTSSPNK